MHNGPTFHPHVTLVSLDIKDKSLEELKGITHTVVAASAFVSPISLDQEGVQVGDTFHQSVYLALNPTEELMKLRSNLLNALGTPANPETPAFPHASLYYGEVSKDDKLRLVTQMTLLDTRGDGAVVVKRLNSRLDLTQVWIVDIIADDPASWVVLHKEAIVTSTGTLPHTDTFTFAQQPTTTSPPSPSISSGSSPTTPSSRQNSSDATTSGASGPDTSTRATAISISSERSPVNVPSTKATAEATIKPPATTEKANPSVGE